MASRKRKAASRGAKQTNRPPARGRRAKGGVATATRKSAASTTTRAGGARVAKKKSAGRKAGKATVAATRLMRVRQLDPQAACGQGTTVMQLFRVDDLPVGTETTHLVFFDRHGWYCEHGRECPAVAAVRRHHR